jgi:hypothetical protein
MLGAPEVQQPGLVGGSDSNLKTSQCRTEFHSLLQQQRSYEKRQINALVSLAVDENVIPRSLGSHGLQPTGPL